VYDYKTGQGTIQKQDMYDGLKLQLPLYLFAAKEIIKAELDENFEPEGALLYSLKYNASFFGKNEIKFGKNIGSAEKAALYDELIDICLKAIKSYVDGISSGDFRLSQIDKREEKACRFCGFRAICRIQEAG
jgi:ATP-dependent helicase/DNAse subunit B